MRAGSRGAGLCVGVDGASAERRGAEQQAGSQRDRWRCSLPVQASAFLLLVSCWLARACTKAAGERGRWGPDPPCDWRVRRPVLFGIGGCYRDAEKGRIVGWSVARGAGSERGIEGADLIITADGWAALQSCAVQCGAVQCGAADGRLSSSSSWICQVGSAGRKCATGLCHATGAFLFFSLLSFWRLRSVLFRLFFCPSASPGQCSTPASGPAWGWNRPERALRPQVCVRSMYGVRTEYYLLPVPRTWRLTRCGVKNHGETALQHASRPVPSALSL